MKSQIIPAIFFTLPLGAMCNILDELVATECLSWMKWDVGEGCCGVDATKCGPGTEVVCGAGKYKDDKLFGTKIGSDKVAACCSPVATCKDITCGVPVLGAPGYGKAYKRKEGVTDTTPCAGSAELCSAAVDTTCCVKDKARCGGYGSVPSDTSCGNGSVPMYWDDELPGIPLGLDPKADCCSPVATCKDVTCGVAYKKKESVKTYKGEKTQCRGAASDCTIDSVCCEMDSTKCGAVPDLPGICGVAKIPDTSKLDSLVDSKQNALGADDIVASCCKEKPRDVYGPQCVVGDASSGAQKPQWKGQAASLILAVAGAAAAM